MAVARHQRCCESCLTQRKIVHLLVALFAVFLVAVVARGDELGPPGDISTATKPGHLFYLTDTPTREQWSALMAEGEPPFCVCLSAARRDRELAENEAKDDLIRSLRFERDVLSKQLTDVTGERDGAVAAKDAADEKAIRATLKSTWPKGRVVIGSLSFAAGLYAGSRL